VSSPTSYRLAQSTDIDALAQMRSAEWGNDEYWMKRISGYMNAETRPKDALIPRACFVAIVAGAVVGFVAGHLTVRFGCDGELQWIDVARERRREGIASELLRLMAAWFIEQQAFRVCVDVEPTNFAARKFYTKHLADEFTDHWLIWNDISVLKTLR
jgi:ribosomal protein S18 acetylase RimI-like enzyme